MALDVYSDYSSQKIMKKFNNRKFDYYGFTIPLDFVYKHINEAVRNFMWDDYDHVCRHCCEVDSDGECYCFHDSSFPECGLFEEFVENDELATEVFEDYTTEVDFRELKIDTPERDAFVAKVNATIERARPHLERQGIEAPGIWE